jgi:ATP-dependent protease ClpP protease subunit
MSISNFNTKTRTINLIGEIEEEMTALVLQALTEMPSDSKQITVFLSTHGGNVYDGLAIYDLFQACSSPVVVIGTGRVMSMGVVILQAGDRRLVTPNTTLMCHMGTTGGYRDTVPNMLADMKQADINFRTHAGIVAKRMGISVEGFISLFSTNKYFDAKGAIARGLIDGIYAGEGVSA